MRKYAKGGSRIDDVCQMEDIPDERNGLSQFHISLNDQFHNLIQDGRQARNNQCQHKTLLFCFIISYAALPYFHRHNKTAPDISDAVPF